VKKKKCLKCGKDFDCKSLKAKWCSSACGRRYLEILKIKNCLFCDKQFIGTQNKKYCSGQCVANKRADHLIKIQQANRKYPKIEGLNRCQIYRRFNPDKGREELNRDNIKRVVIIQYLGGKCSKCGYNEDIRALQLDHIDGDGFKDRKEKKTNKVYRYYVKNLEESKKILQVLCANCHAIKSIENRDHDGKKSKEYRETLKHLHHK